jgi:hypothetical protein
MIKDWLAVWAKLAPQTKLVVAGGAGALVLLLIGLLVAIGIGRGCSSREDVIARVSIVSSRLQEAAAQGRIKVDRLAEGVKQVNAAATAYESNKDHQAYCDALDQVSEEFDLSD